MNTKYLTYIKQYLKSYATSVAMATMTFQDGGYFGFKSNLNLTTSATPKFYLKKAISLSIINYFDNLKKILWSQKKLI
jgi:hypothetical protein